LYSLVLTLKYITPDKIAQCVLRFQLRSRWIELKAIKRDCCVALRLVLDYCVETAAIFSKVEVLFYDLVTGVGLAVYPNRILDTAFRDAKCTLARNKVTVCSFDDLAACQLRIIKSSNLFAFEHLRQEQSRNKTGGAMGYSYCRSHHIA